MTDYKNVDGVLVPLTGAEISERASALVTYNSAVTNNAVKQQIVVLEQSITDRRRDEAILGQDNGWLANVRSQIATLRSQLQG